MTAILTSSPQPIAKIGGVYIPSPKILLLGATGTGKTYSIRSLVDAGLSVAAIFTEPGMEVVADVSCERGMHFHYIPQASPSWATMVDSATKINQLSFEALTKLGDINKREYSGFIDLLNTCGNFKCDRCGETVGPIDALAPDKWAVVLDSLSGLNVMAMNLVTGSKPVKSMADWGVAMDNLERFIIKLTTDVPCLVAVLAHMEREFDEVTGGVSLMAATLGKKLAPRLPRNFSDVVVCKREGAKFSWSTASANVDLKARNLPLSENLPPDFRPLLAAWKKRAGL